MNENIKFTKAAKNGAYSKNDTGVLVAFSREYTDQLVAVVRLTNNSYTIAPIGDIEYVAGS